MPKLSLATFNRKVVTCMKRFIWFSDTHLNLSVLPFLKRLFIRNLKNSCADGIFITGDISSGPFLESDLKFLATHFDGPVYFVLGNHDYHGRHIESVHSDVRRLTNIYPNLHWMTESGVVTIAPDVALIGHDGWYDGSAGNSNLLKWTIDRFFTFDFFHLDDMKQQLGMWKQMALQSSKHIENLLKIALENHNTIYVMTHVPPWRQAIKVEGSRLEKLWLAYNTNVVLGETIERVMKNVRGKRVVVLSGHTHIPCHIRVTQNIECHVARASYLGRVREEETIVILCFEHTYAGKVK